MKLRLLIGAGILACGTAVGLYHSLHSWGGVVYLSQNRFVKSRFPAAYHKVFDLSHLDGSALKLESQKRLVTAAEFLKEGNQIGIELGHFVTKGVDGQKEFACNYYDRVEITFKAKGMAESGQRPLMHVDAPCRMSADVNQMAPVWIPVARLLKEKPTEMELTYPDLEGMHFKFEHLAGEWPEGWVLSSVRLYHQSETGRVLEISDVEMRKIIEEPKIFSWAAPAATVKQ